MGKQHTQYILDGEVENEADEDVKYPFVLGSHFEVLHVYVLYLYNFDFNLLLFNLLIRP